jgi:hypothetical protein
MEPKQMTVDEIISWLDKYMKFYKAEARADTLNCIFALARQNGWIKEKVVKWQWLWKHTGLSRWEGITEHRTEAEQGESLNGNHGVLVYKKLDESRTEE